MKRRFLVEVEIDEDPEMVFTKSKILEAIEEYVSLLTECRYDEYELEVKEYAPSVKEALDHKLLKEGIKTPEEIRRIL